jgi:hypothetical protein
MIVLEVIGLIVSGFERTILRTPSWLEVQLQLSFYTRNIFLSNITRLPTTVPDSFFADWFTWDEVAGSLVNFARISVMRGWVTLDT